MAGKITSDVFLCNAAFLSGYCVAITGALNGGCVDFGADLYNQISSLGLALWMRDIRQRQAHTTPPAPVSSYTPAWSEAVTFPEAQDFGVSWIDRDGNLNAPFNDIISSYRPPPLVFPDNSGVQDTRFTPDNLGVILMGRVKTHDPRENIGPQMYCSWNSGFFHIPEAPHLGVISVLNNLCCLAKDLICFLELLELSTTNVDRRLNLCILPLNRNSVPRLLIGELLYSHLIAIAWQTTHGSGCGVDIDKVDVRAPTRQRPARHGRVTSVPSVTAGFDGCWRTICVRHLKHPELSHPPDIRSDKCLRTVEVTKTPNLIADQISASPANATRMLAARRN
ncbi:hypothetical protein B0H19DRAFT_1074341 [Mycena capillaripes]|nr:hypothetical protein B0H19DRAFT_1074341 [Mycena capillaripes]